MLFAANGLIGCPVKASDGEAGTVDDFLFDDRTWLIRWLSVAAGPWLEGRKVLVAPSAIAPIVIPPKPAFPMLSFGEPLTLSLALTRAEIESGPQALADEPAGRLGGVARSWVSAFTPRTARSGRSRLSSPTMRTGPFAISLSPRTRGCPENRCNSRRSP